MKFKINLLERKKRSIQSWSWLNLNLVLKIPNFQLLVSFLSPETIIDHHVSKWILASVDERRHTIYIIISKTSHKFVINIILFQNNFRNSVWLKIGNPQSAVFPFYHGLAAASMCSDAQLQRAAAASAKSCARFAFCNLADDEGRRMGGGLVTSAEWTSDDPTGKRSLTFFVNFRMFLRVRGRPCTTPNSCEVFRFKFRAFDLSFVFWNYDQRMILDWFMIVILDLKVSITILWLS